MQTLLYIIAALQIIQLGAIGVLIGLNLRSRQADGMLVRANRFRAEHPEMWIWKHETPAEREARASQIIHQPGGYGSKTSQAQPPEGE